MKVPNEGFGNASKLIKRRNKTKKRKQTKKTTQIN